MSSFNTYSYPSSNVGSYQPPSSAGSTSDFQSLKKFVLKKLDEYEMRLNQNTRIIKIRNSYLGHNIKLFHSFVLILSLLLFTLIYNYSGIVVLSSFIGVVYPFYQSLKVLNVNFDVINNNNADYNLTSNHMLWLSYWIFYGLFNLFESILFNILLSWMGNLYQFAKIVFFLYLYHPNTKGSLFLYKHVLQPFVYKLIAYEDILLNNVYSLKKNLSIDAINNKSNIDNNNNNMATTGLNTTTQQQQQQQQLPSSYVAPPQQTNFNSYPTAPTTTAPMINNMNYGTSTLPGATYQPTYVMPAGLGATTTTYPVTNDMNMNMDMNANNMNNNMYRGERI